MPMMTITFKRPKLYSSYFTIVKYDTIQKKFSATAKRFLDETTGAVILSVHATNSPPLFMAILFISYGLATGAYLLRNLMRAGRDAQFIEMFPNELEDLFFFVPDHIMRLFHRYLDAIRQALDFWNNPESLASLSPQEAFLIWQRLYHLRPLLMQMRQHCVFITDLDDPEVNGHLEFINRHIQELDQLIQKIAEVHLAIGAIIF